MPCYTEPPSAYENTERDLNNLLDEIGEGTPRIGSGNIWGRMRNLSINEMTQMLCEWCQKNDVTEKSLELQIWWRDHQKADRKRTRREKNEQAQAKLAVQARKKLTTAEFEALATMITRG